MQEVADLEPDDDEAEPRLTARQLARVAERLRELRGSAISQRELARRRGCPPEPSVRSSRGAMSRGWERCSPCVERLVLARSKNYLARCLRQRSIRFGTNDDCQLAASNRVCRNGAYVPLQRSGLPQARRTVADRVNTGPLKPGMPLTLVR
jgi:hypothetical protein